MEHFDKILFLISEDNYPLRKALKEVKVSSATFYEYIKNNEDEQKRYACACEERANNIFEEILEIADSDDGIVYDEQGNKRKDIGRIQEKRLQIDSRKWMVGKINPKKYGDKIDVTTDGEKITTQSIPLVLQDGRSYEDLKNELKPE